MSADVYKTIKSVSNGVYKEKGSRFLASAYPVTEETEIKAIIEQVRKEHHDARHNCYAWITGRDGSAWRANDDGEPSGTAGRPILGQIKSHELTNILITVSRYFGGTLLGVSGLINAYKTAAGEAIGKAEIIDHLIHDYYELKFPYAIMNDIMKIIKEENINQSEHSFDLECSIKIDFRASLKEKIFTRLTRLDGFSMTFLEEK